MKKYMSKREQTKREVDSFQLNFLAVNPFSLKPLFGQVTTHKQFERPPKKEKKKRFLTIKKKCNQNKRVCCMEKG